MNEKSFVEGMKYERKVWSDIILSDPLVQKYKEKYCGNEEFSADDAASLMSILADELEEAIRYSTAWKCLARKYHSIIKNVRRE